MSGIGGTVQRLQTDNMVYFLQKIVSQQTDKRRARDTTKKNKRKERDRKGKGNDLKM